MPNYQNSIIYKLCCKDPTITDIYIGSTTNFIRRKCQHKYSTTNVNSKEYEFYNYVFIRGNGGWDNWSMIEIEKVNVSDKRELEKKEREYIEKFNASLNKKIPTRTRTGKENYQIYKSYHDNYQNMNQEQLRQKKKVYYHANKSKLNKKFDCECGGKYTHQSKKIHVKTIMHKQFIKNNN